MSAIAGIYHMNGEHIPPEHGEGLMKVLAEFPADDRQVWYKNPIYFGCHAQWITPEAIEERLPFYDYERQLVITADAIIDNREELFERLQIKKAKRKVISDSELILLAYDKWQDECPKCLIGDFAFMIWDEKKHRLFGARDFSGSRTLYFMSNQHVFAFSTVIKPLFSLPYLDKKLNEQWIAEYLANPGMFDSIDPASTVYKGVHQLPPSHSIAVKDGIVKLNRYSTLTQGERLRLGSNEEYVEAFREIFQKAVQARLRTHKAVGGHLSGGLDSGSVAAFAAKELKREGKQLHTFSYVPVEGFSDWTPKSRVANERPMIEKTVNYIGNISANYLSFDDRHPYSEINDWLDIIEMPYKFFENTFWLRGIYEEAQKRGMGVLLNGQRGNWSISWGPVFDYYAFLFRSLRWFKLNQELNAYGSKIGRGKRKLMSSVNRKLYPSFYKEKDSGYPTYINKDFASRTRVLERLEEHHIDPSGKVDNDFYKIRIRQFQQLYFWNTTGTYGTKLSLRYGLVDRDPTNDLRVIRFCLSLPEEQCVQNGYDRALIRRATEGYLPDDIRLNMLTRGVQGSDGVHRMKSDWARFIAEFQAVKNNPIMRETIDLNVLENCLYSIQHDPSPKHIFGYEFKVVMRALIYYRFIQAFERG
jgi:asparagine synthase (glutamine-hydrolysing)